MILQHSFIFGGLFKSIFSSVQTAIVAIVGGLVASSLAYFVPITYPVLACCLFILVDMYYGIQVGKQMKEKYKDDESIKAFLSSAKWRNTPRKFIEAFIAITLAHILDTAIITSIDLHAVEFMAGLIATGEAISILENLKALKPNNPWVKLAGTFVESKAEKYLDITIEKGDLNKVRKLVKNTK